MSLVNNTIRNLVGQPAAGIIQIVLSWDTSVSPVAKDNDTDVFFERSVTIATDSSGEWSAELTPNADITPANSVYKITETVSSIPYVYYITVTGSDAWVGDIIVDPPSWEL